MANNGNGDGQANKILWWMLAAAFVGVQFFGGLVLKNIMDQVAVVRTAQESVQQVKIDLAKIQAAQDGIKEDLADTRADIREINGKLDGLRGQ